MDGGSSVAVLTYLRQILESLDHPDMINLILHFLLGLPDVVTAAPEPSSNSVSKARKRKSMDLATMMASKTDDAADPLLFTLVDLILACLRSSSHQTIHVTLQLVSAILKRHHRYAVTTLIRTDTLYGEIVHRTVGAQKQEVEFLMSLAGSIGGQDNFDEVFENILKDTTARIESHPCSLRLTLPKISTINHKLPTVPDSLPGAPRDVRPHTIRSDDPLLGILLDHLEVFFLNPVETNLSITETVFDLAVCGFMNLEGWLLRSPSKYIYDSNDSYRPLSPTEENEDTMDVDAEDILSDDPKKLDAVNKCRRRPVWSSSDLPRLLKILQSLTDQVAAYRGSIPRFHDLLQQRREAFQIADAPPLPARPAPAQAIGTPGSAVSNFAESSVHTSRSGSPARAGGLEGFAQRLLKDLNDLGTPSRSSSPRSRGPPGSSGGYGIGTPSSINKPLPAPPREFPLGYDTPSKGSRNLASPFSPGNQKPEEDHILASQAAAFQAIDQQILARKVGLPIKPSTDPQPLKLGEKISQGSDETDGPREEGGHKPSSAPENQDQAAQPQAEETGDDTQTTITIPERTVQSSEDKKVSVSHVLTNIIVLQSFLFELAALVEVRAGLFDEVRHG